MRLVGVLLSIGALSAASGCRREPPNSPEAAYRGFIDALQKGNTKRAWDSLSPSTRQRAGERSKAIAEASKGVVRDEPELLLFQGTRPAPITEISQVSADDDSALLKVATASGSTEVKLVKDGGKWLVDLSESLERRGQP